MRRYARASAGAPIGICELGRGPARDREAFDAHWRRLLADDSLTKKTILYEGEVAGNVGCWEQEGRRLIGYWIGREFWGKGLATRALQELTGEVTLRPLHAWVATSNVASIRVLEKCGFVRVGSQEERRRRAALRATRQPLAVKGIAAQRFVTRARADFRRD